jgi:AcrR family transcriptional regulator
MSNLVGGRTNQKLRTHVALVEAAAQLVREGKTFTVAEVADLARVGRTTAYRYFPTVEQLVVHASLYATTEVEKQMIGAALESSTSPDDRLQAVVEASDTSINDHDYLYRTMLQQSLNGQNSGGEGLPRRSGARRAVIDSAIGDLRKLLGEKQYEKLTATLSLFIGIEAAVVLRDVCLMSREKAREAKVWGAIALLKAALAEAKQRPMVTKQTLKGRRSAGSPRSSSSQVAARR